MATALLSVAVAQGTTFSRARRRGLVGSASVPWLAYLCLGSSMAIVGSYVGLSKVLVGIFPVFLLAWLRFGIAAVAMLGWLRSGGTDPRLGPRERRLLFLQSFFGNFLFSICMLYGVSMSSALAAGVIMSALPAVVAIFSRGLLHERITRRVAVGIASAMAGIALVSVQRSMPQVAGAGGAALVGNALLLGAVCCEALYVVIGKSLVAHLRPTRVSAFINLWGLALVTPFGVWQALSFRFAAVDAHAWALLVAYSLAASVATVWLWMTGLRRVKAAAAGTFTVLLPISAGLVGVAFLGERLEATQAAAFLLGLAGIVLATWPEKGATVGA